MSNELFIFDVDDTLVFGQSQMLFIQYAYKKKLITTFEYSRIIFGFILYKLHIVKDPKKVMELGLSFFKGKTISEINTLVDDFFNSTLKHKFNTKIADVIKKAQDNGGTVLLVSNAICPIVGAVSKYFNITDILCTQVGSESGIFSGTIEGDLMYGINKLSATKSYIEKSGKSYQKKWVYTDHHSDIPLLEWATNPVAVNPDKILRRKAEAEGWQIITQQ